MTLSSQKSPSSSVFLLFDQEPSFDGDDVLKGIRQLEPERHAPGCRAIIQDNLMQFDSHMFAMLPIFAPIPADEITPVIDSAFWTEEAKAPMRHHQAHIACLAMQNGEDTTEQFVAILKLATALVPHGLVGLLDLDAGVAIPGAVLPYLVTVDGLAEARGRIPVGVWTGFEQFQRPDGCIWFRSRGFHRWGKPDLAYLGNEEEAEAVRDLFEGLLAYMRDSDTHFQPGETANNGQTQLRFASVTEYHAWLDGTGTTIVIEID